jgi:hypothetical protein
MRDERKSGIEAMMDKAMRQRGIRQSGHQAKRRFFPYSSFLIPSYYLIILALVVALASCKPPTTNQPALPTRQEVTMTSQTANTLPSTAAPTQSPAPTQITTPNPRGSIVGAIRWDAWVGELPTFGDAASENRVGVVVERTLAANKWHYRLPFYAVEVGENQVQVRGATQEVMDKEIEYAKNAGIDYWAYVFYPPGSGLDAARNLHLASPHRADVKFSLIIDNISYLKDPEMVKLFVSYFKMPEFQKVLDGRPLLFLFGTTGLTDEENEANKKAIDFIRQETIAAGAANPYIVYMGWASATVRIYIEKYGLDAGSAYAAVGNGGVPFAQLAKSAEGGWDSYRYTRLKVIPWVTSGWDPRPRVENPTPWTTYDPNGWAQPGTPEEIAAHLQNALQWNAKYPAVAEANAVLIYSWNEFDEGGWICPTLKNGSDRLDAIRKILR